MDFPTAFDSPREECGVFGVFAEGEDVARLTYFGLFALQHRGQESAGIAVGDGSKIRTFRDMGLVSQVFDERILAGLTGHVSIGHTRYSTTGSSLLCNAQPVVCESHYGTVAIAHNGNLINTSKLRAELVAAGETFESTSDTEVIAKLIARSSASTVEEAVAEMMERVSGAYSLLILTEDKLIGVRDPYGIRPLSLGKLNGGKQYVLSSETCALNLVGGKFMREVEPGEMVIIDKTGVRELQAVPLNRHALCVFEFIYFARPDSLMYGKPIQGCRRRMGHELSREHPIDADVVIPIPDTGTPAAIGYAQASRTAYDEGVIKNRYVQRTFIQPDQRMRALGVRMKLSPLKETLAGKRVVMVDDSIVRGTTTGPTIKLLRDAGAAEVHVRISSPPIKYPCFFGIDMAKQKELIASQKTVDEIRDHVQADSLGYLSIPGLVRALGLRREKFCMACFDGKYPIEIPDDIKVSKFALEQDGSHPCDENCLGLLGVRKTVG